MTTEAIRPARIEGAKNDGASPENKALAGAPENKAARTRDPDVRVGRPAPPAEGEISDPRASSL